MKLSIYRRIGKYFAILLIIAIAIFIIVFIASSKGGDSGNINQGITTSNP